MDMRLFSSMFDIRNASDARHHYMGYFDSCVRSILMGNRKFTEIHIELEYFKKGMNSYSSHLDTLEDDLRYFAESYGLLFEKIVQDDAWILGLSRDEKTLKQWKEAYKIKSLNERVGAVSQICGYHKDKVEEYVRWLKKTSRARKVKNKRASGK